jgi:hypothetical protein
MLAPIKAFSGEPIYLTFDKNLLSINTKKVMADSIFFRKSEYDNWMATFVDI